MQVCTVAEEAGPGAAYVQFHPGHPASLFVFIMLTITDGNTSRNMKECYRVIGS